MAYSDFTREQVSKRFALVIAEQVSLFSGVPPVELDAFSPSSLQQTIPLAAAIGTEKARSEMIIAPILIELRRILQKQISLFSGIEFNVDPARGLNGVCDFLISQSRQQMFVTYPVVAIIEAKNDNIKSGYAQCIAAMLAAQVFNEREGHTAAIIYGAVTTGQQWKYVKLQNSTVYIDFVSSCPLRGRQPPPRRAIAGLPNPSSLPIFCYNKAALCNHLAAPNLEPLIIRRTRRDGGTL